MATSDIAAPLWRPITLPRHRRRYRRPQLPDLLGCALLLLEDACPPEEAMHLCAMEEDATEDACSRCWRAYLYYVANGRKHDPYINERTYEGGLKP